MIGSLRGTLLDRAADEVLVEVAGVGHRVTVAPVTGATLGEVGEVVFLHVHHHIREDAQQLFGFTALDDRVCFEALLGAHGVGPALALGIDRNPGMMAQRPRPPSAALLTRGGIRFILTTGLLKAAMGLLLFFSLPALAFSGSTTQTAVFLYESLAQLAFVYPARRITSKSLPNRTLNFIIIGSVALQILTLTVPGLRTMLGLVPLNVPVLGLVAGALIITVVGAEVWSRRAAGRDDY